MHGMAADEGLGERGNESEVYDSACFLADQSHCHVKYVPDL